MLEADGIPQRTLAVAHVGPLQQIHFPWSADAQMVVADDSSEPLDLADAGP
ncbi:hypothetical protein D3C81_2219310 [compost metagenome]